MPDRHRQSSLPRKLLTVLLGAPTEAMRISESQKLTLIEAFAATKGRRLYEAGKPVRH